MCRCSLAAAVCIQGDNSRGQFKGTIQGDGGFDDDLLSLYIYSPREHAATSSAPSQDGFNVFTEAVITQNEISNCALDYENASHY